MTTTESPAPAGSPGVLRTRLLPSRLPPNSVARPALVARVQRALWDARFEALDEVIEDLTAKEKRHGRKRRT